MSRAELHHAAEPAAVFAALGDPTRLSLLAALDGRERSITALAAATRESAGIAVSRQALTKHLDVLERARLVRSRKVGRETRFEVRPDTLDEARRYLDRVAAQWDDALHRLKAFVEET